MIAKQTHGEDILKRFSLSEEAFLGAGSESRVYSLNDSQILRIYAPGTSLDSIYKLKEFYDSIRGRDTVPFVIPMITEIEDHQGCFHSIEPRIKGVNLSEHLRGLAADSRTYALCQYAKAVGQIKSLRINHNNYYGEILASKPLKNVSWVQFLLDRVDQTLAASFYDLTLDIPHIERIICNWKKQLVETVGDVEYALVHGDVFPGNTMVDDQGNVIAIIDFSPMTLIGDWRLDLVAALIFLEVTDVYQNTDSQIVIAVLKEIYRKLDVKLLGCYRTYYALYFSYAKRDDLKLYQWCIKSLVEAENYS